MTVIKVDIREVHNMRPEWNDRSFLRIDLVEYERGTDPLDGYVLYGFDEIGKFVKTNAAYAFVGQ
jgi:hypothetical protein